MGHLLSPPHQIHHSLQLRLPLLAKSAPRPQIHLNRCNQNQYITSIYFFLGKEIKKVSPNALALLDLDADIHPSDSSSQTAAATPAWVGHNLNNTHGHRRFSPYISSCNGLVCFCLCKETTYEPRLVCNPVPGQTLSLPPLPIEAKELDVVFGIGFDRDTGQYKVVRIINHEENDTLPSRMGAEIYTLLEGTGSWRDVGVPYSLSFTRDPVGLFVDGELHWWLEKEDTYYILSMDMEREKFHTVQAPEMGLWACGMMIDWKGCVGIVEYEAARSCTNIWVLKMASTWTIDISIEWNLSPETHQLVLVNYSINCNLERILPKKRFEQILSPCITHKPSFIPLGVQKNGEILVLCAWCVLASYDLESSRFTIIEVEFPCLTKSVPKSVSLMASFVSL